MSIDHYENFPVASVLLPPRLRRPVSLIYRFAREADDFADEGSRSDAERLALLENFRMELRQIDRGNSPQTPLFRDLSEIIQEYRLPTPLFFDLLDAFTQDVTKKRYADFSEVMSYCNRSANPVGRLLLQLYEAATPVNIAYSDRICSSLQLINFLQDVAIDIKKGRVYLPQDEMTRFGIEEADIEHGNPGRKWGPFMQFQIERSRNMLREGAPLGKILRGRIGLELRMIVMGGETLLRKLQRCRGDVFHARPVLRPADWGYMFFRAVIG